MFNTYTTPSLYPRGANEIEAAGRELEKRLELERAIECESENGQTKKSLFAALVTILFS